MSLRFENTSSFIVAGPSSVGKTFWVLRFVNSLKEFCTETKRVIYHYEVWQELLDKYANKIDFKQVVPNLEDLKEYQNAFVILDDLMFANAKFLAKIYSVYSYHFRFSVLMTVQNLFHKGSARDKLNDCSFYKLYSHQRPHPTTRSPMSVEIGPEACILVARRQTWQGHASCLKIQLVGSLEVPTSLHQCSGSPAVG